MATETGRKDLDWIAAVYGVQPRRRAALAGLAVLMTIATAHAQERMREFPLLAASSLSSARDGTVKFTYDRNDFADSLTSKLLALESVVAPPRGGGAAGALDVAAVAARVHVVVAQEAASSVGFGGARLAAQRYATRALIDALTARGPGQERARLALKEDAQDYRSTQRALAVLDRATSSLDLDFEAKPELARRLAPLSSFLRTQRAYDDPEAAIPALARVFDGATSDESRPVAADLTASRPASAAKARVSLAPYSPYRDSAPLQTRPRLDWEQARGVLFEAQRHWFTLDDNARLRRRAEDVLEDLSGAVSSDPQALARFGRDLALRADVDQLAARLAVWRREDLRDLREASALLARRLEQEHPLEAVMAKRARRWRLVRTLYFDRPSSGIIEKLVSSAVCIALAPYTGVGIGPLAAMAVVFGLVAAHFEYVRWLGRRLNESGANADSWRLPHVNKHLAARRKLFGGAPARQLRVAEDEPKAAELPVFK